MRQGTGRILHLRTSIWKKKLPQIIQNLFWKTVRSIIELDLFVQPYWIQNELKVVIPDQYEALHTTATADTNRKVYHGFVRVLLWFLCHRIKGEIPTDQFNYSLKIGKGHSCVGTINSEDRTSVTTVHRIWHSSPQRSWLPSCISSHAFLAL